MRDVVSILQRDSVSVTTLMQQTPHWQSRALGALCFSVNEDESKLIAIGTEIPCINVPMQRLDASDSICEIWHGSEDIKQGWHDAVYYRHNDDVLFGVVTLPEMRYVAGASKTALQQATESAYRQIFSLINSLRYPYLYRCWNYLADINGLDHSEHNGLDSGQLDRYSQFNLGRQDAFLAHGRDVTGNVPAACALGFTQGPLTIAFLAGRVASVSIENPRQISAYQYPKQYGPRSPTFARASLVRLSQRELLFISGTASIVGHATLHPTDVAVQTQETMANIEAVLTEANRVAHQPKFCLTDLCYRVYVRHAADWKKVQAEIIQYIGSTPNAVYLQADVCRQDLLLEIEATTEYSLVPVPKAES